MYILKQHHLCLSFCGHYQGHELSSLLLLLTQLVFVCIQVEHAAIHLVRQDTRGMTQGTTAFLKTLQDRQDCISSQWRDEGLSGC